MYIRSQHIDPNIYHQDVVCCRLFSVIVTVSEVTVRQYLLHPEHSSTHSCSKKDTLFHKDNPRLRESRATTTWNTGFLTALQSPLAAVMRGPSGPA